MRQGKLLKYRTKDDEIAANLLKAEQESLINNNSDRENKIQSRLEDRGSPDMQRIRQNMQRMDSFAINRPQDAKKGISGEKGMQRLGSQDGKISVSYCWTVKRDVFEVPMLLVINFLPCI